MKKTVLIFGLISGAIPTGMMLATVPFVDKVGFDKGEIIGYTTIVISALLVFWHSVLPRECLGRSADVC